ADEESIGLARTADGPLPASDRPSLSDLAKSQECQKLTLGAGAQHTSWPQLVEQRLGLLEDRRFEALSEPTVGRGEEIVGSIVLALIAPEPGEAGRGAQLPELGALLLGRGNGMTIAPLRSGGLLTGAQQLASDPI